ncbi:MAG: inositol monophosphatase [Gemmataceae bacterium]|nr:inositol monophosphatase [Gemmataceae bacterium]
MLQVAVEAAAAAARELERWRASFSVREKGRADLVTDADHAAQEVIRRTLLTAFPQHRFLGEEDAVGLSPEQTRPTTNAPPTWVVDPLDGTSNYVHDVPAYCVSIGLWYAGQGWLGVIHDPRLQEVFTAVRGRGAFCNGQPLRVSATPALRDSLLSTGFPADYRRQLRNLAAWQHLSAYAQTLRRTGSTALNLAYVAAGRHDGYWAFDNYAWDVLAGAILVLEAGGTVTTTSGQPFDPFQPDIVATNGHIHQELLQRLAELPPSPPAERP